MEKILQDKLKVLSANCRGLKDKIKRYDVLNYIQNTEANIICLQDTHLTELDSPEVKTLWDGDFILNGRANNARGVAILFRKNFEYEIINQETDNEGNLLIVSLKINEMKLKIINIYWAK